MNIAASTNDPARVPVSGNLAIVGGRPTRQRPMPPRLALGPTEQAAIQEVIAYYRERGLDLGYQGVFEKQYTDAFVEQMGRGHADAVATRGIAFGRSSRYPMRRQRVRSAFDSISFLLRFHRRTSNGSICDSPAVATGTAGLFVAVAALGLPPGSEVIVSPITDPGSIAAIVLNRLVPRVADSLPDSYNIGVEQFVERITPNIHAVRVVHSIGRAADIVGIFRQAHTWDVIEDSSQSHGANVNGCPVGHSPLADVVVAR